MQRMSAKELKEAFVAGHTGTSPSEILLICTSAPIGVFLYHEIRHYMKLSSIYLSNNDDVSTIVLIFIESMTVLLPMAICQTEFLFPYGIMLLAFELILGLFLFFHRRYFYKRKERHDENRTSKFSGSSQLSMTKTIKGVTTSNLEFLTFYRSTVSYLTFVAILAVDFTVFPRSYAKTEVYGYGLMDLGAASFCVMGGLVSSFSRSRNANTSNGNKKVHQNRGSHNEMVKILHRSIPLLIMGMVRLITTKGIEYQEHVSEYGVHWNFFFTLALITISTTLMRKILKIHSLISSWVLFLAYQSMLSLGKVQIYIESAPRVCENNFFLCNFFAANREGILGSIGYLIIFLACEDIGYYCIWSVDSHHPSTQGNHLLVITITFWFLHWLSSSTRTCGIVASRRSTNATFILWAIAHNMTILLLTWLSFYNSSNGSYGNKATTPPIFSAVNRHGLIMFIFANLMTGAVNLSINTLEASRQKAIIFIFGYLCSVGAVALLVDSALTKVIFKQDRG